MRLRLCHDWQDWDYRRSPRRIVFTVAFSPKQPLSRLLSSLLFAYWSQRLLVIDYNVPRARAIELCVGTLLHCGLVYPRTIKFSLPSLYPRHHSRDKIFQAFPAFRTASDKSWVEAWERGYGPLVTLGVEASPCDFFSLFLDESVLDLLVEETNRLVDNDKYHVHILDSIMYSTDKITCLHAYTHTKLC